MNIQLCLTFPLSRLCSPRYMLRNYQLLPKLNLSLTLCSCRAQGFQSYHLNFMFDPSTMMYSDSFYRFCFYFFIKFIFCRPLMVTFVKHTMLTSRSVTTVCTWKYARRRYLCYSLFFYWLFSSNALFQNLY